jgi:iron(III) transport system ATP-binding protein
MTIHQPLAGEEAEPTAGPPLVPALVVHDLERSFGDHVVLDGASLAVARGEVVALVGPSGCGKTTLVRTVAGFEHADAGTVQLAGRVVGRAGSGAAVHVAPERRRVGVVPQEGALFPHLDVAGNIGFGLPRGGRTAQGRDRVAALLELVGLAGLGARRPDQLSGGQQQRVAVARALAPRPELVLLDEPFSALDASLRVSVRDAVMAAVRAERASALLVTHDQDEALSVADTVAVMLDGRIAQVGSPEEVYQRPVSAAVARFLGEALVLAGEAAGATVRSALGDLALAAPAHGPIEVLVRPEQVAVELAPAGEPHAATVTEVSFHGHDALVGLVLPDGGPAQARLPGGWVPQPGARVLVEVRGEAWPLQS